MKEKKYALGLALSGGGAKGAAHCGVLQALHEFGLVPDKVAGTSAGSIAAALFCAGLTPVEMSNLFINIDFKDLIGLGKPQAGFFDQAPLVDYLRKVLPVRTFEELSIPCNVVACDLDKARVTVFGRGELAPRIAASCSIPVFFKPMKLDGHTYVDGGLYKNLPVSVLRDDCEKVIAVSVQGTPEGYKNTMLSVSLRVFHMMMKSNTLEEAKMSDIFIELDTSPYSPYDLGNIEKLFHLGYEETVRILQERGYERQMPPQPIKFDHRPAESSLREKLEKTALYAKLNRLLEMQEAKIKKAPIKPIKNDTATTEKK